MPNKTVVIFGATGAVGTSLAERLSREHPEWNIRAVSRNVDGASRLEKLKLPNVFMVSGDPLVKESVLKLTEDADIVVSCVGFHKYQARYWAKNWPTVVENLLQATIQPGRNRKMVFCDNLYAYGSGHDEAISTRTETVTPSTRTKPAIRSQIRRSMQAHMTAHPGTLTVVGGSDFFGPHVKANSFLGDTMTGKIVKGQTPLAVGSASVVHDFCSVSDFARALAVSCTDDRALDRFWICPHAIHNKTMTDIAGDIMVKADQKVVPVSVLPSFFVYLLSPFMEFMWEMIEMLPFWTSDYKIDDSEFTETFGVNATPYDEALDELVSFYQNDT